MLIKLATLFSALADRLKALIAAIHNKLKSLYEVFISTEGWQLVVTVALLILLLVAIGLYRACGLQACDATKVSINALLLWPFDVINTIANGIWTTIWPTEPACKFPSELSAYLPARLSRQEDKDFADILACKLDTWKAVSNNAQMTYLKLSYASVILSTLVAAAAALLPGKERSKALIAWMAAIVAGLLSLLQPADTSRRYQEAWLVLDMRWNEYRHQLDGIDRERLWEAVAEGETIIHQGSKVTDILRSASTTEPGQRTVTPGADTPGTSNMAGGGK